MSTLPQKIISILESFDANNDGVIDNNADLDTLRAELIEAIETVPEDGPIIETDAGGP